MSLDVRLKDPTATYMVESLYDANITHNLNEMAEKAGIYYALWKPYRLLKEYDVPEGDCQAEYEFAENSEIRAKDLIKIIENGLIDLKNRPEYYKQFDSPNGWGLYIHFVPFVEKYLDALKEYPEAIVETSI